MNFKKLLLLAACLFSLGLQAQISIPNTTAVTQPFSIANSSTASLPANWKFSAAGNGTAAGWLTGSNVTATTQFGGTPSCTATGGIYNFATTGSTTERAVGFISSGGYATNNAIMAQYINSNTNAITQLTVGYNLEVYREHSNTSTVELFYSLNGSSWTSVNVSNFNLTGACPSPPSVPITTTNVPSATITGLNVAQNANIYLKWVFISSAAGNAKGIGLDDVSVTAAFASTNSALSTITNDAGFTAPSDIDYKTATNQATDLTAANLDVAQFIITDGNGTNDADALGTTLTDITFTIPTNTVLRKLAIYDGSTEVAEVAVAANATTVAFTGLTGLTAADFGTKTFKLKASFLQTLTDNTQFYFTVNSGSSATASSSGSGFAAFSSFTTPITANLNRIEVTASALAFTTQPSPTTINVNGTFTTTQPVVTASDVNNNRDLDFNFAAVVSNAGTLPMVNAPSPFALGLLSFPANFSYTNSGIGTLTVTSNSITSSASSVITVNPLITTGTTVTGAPFCLNGNGSGSASFSVTGTLTGTFTAKLIASDGITVSNANIGTNTVSPIVITIPSNTSSGTYYVRIDNGSVVGTLSSSFIINQKPTLAINGVTTSAVCAGTAATINLSGLVNSSSSTLSYSVNGSAQSPITNFTASGTGTGSFTVASPVNGQPVAITNIATTSAPACSTAFSTNNSVNLIVNAIPTLTGTSASSTTICTGATSTITLAGLNATASHSIAYSLGGGIGSNISPVTLAAGVNTFTVTLTTANSGQTVTINTVTRTDVTPNCALTPSGGTNTATLPTVNPTVTQPAVITGTDPICEFSTGTNTTAYSSSTSVGTLNWSITPAAGTINSSGLVTWANGYNGTATISVESVGCNGPSTPRTRSVVINPLPIAVPTNTGPYCAGATIQLNAGTVAGATYAWTGPGGYTNNAVSTTTYTQDFSGLGSSSSNWNDNSTIAGWYSATSTTPITTYTASAGTATAGNRYSFGASGSTERALGSIGANSTDDFAHGFLYRNTTGSTITNITVSYTLEEWRDGGPGAGSQSVIVSYRTSSSAITALTPISPAPPAVQTGWTGVAGLTLSNPIASGTAGALDGNLAANRVSANNVSIGSISLAPLDYIMIKWEDPNHAGNDHGFGIDDVTIVFTHGSQPQNPTIASSTTAMAGSYQLVVTSAAGCASLPVSTTVNVASTTALSTGGTLTPSSSSVCGTSSSITINGSAVTPPTNATTLYAWYVTVPGGSATAMGITTEDITTNYNLTALGTYTFERRAYTNCNGSATAGFQSATTTVTVGSTTAPSAGTITQPTTPVCAGTVINSINGSTITAPTGTTVNYAWYVTVPSGTPVAMGITTEDITTNYTLSTAGTYTFERRVWTNCSGSETSGYQSATTTIAVGASEPTAAATSVSVTAAGLTTMSVGWTNGNGARRIVVARLTSTTPVPPTDGTVYTASTVFSSPNGTTGLGNVVVYNNTGSSVSVTGLANSSNYTFDVYEFNHIGNACPNYYATPASVAYSTGPTKVQFVSATATVAEGVSTYNITLSIANPDPTVTTYGEINFLSGSSTGQAADISNFGLANFIFPAGSTANQTVTITVFDDALVEPTETFVFDLQNVGGGINAGEGIINQFTLSITDNEAVGTIIYSTGSGSASTDAIWSYNPAGPGQTITSLVFGTPNGFAATAGKDFVIQNGHTIVLPSGQVYNMKDLNVQAGAQLWGGTFNPITYSFINLFGDATINGTLGNSASAGDGLGINFAGTSNTVGGTGVVNISRIKKPAAADLPASNPIAVATTAATLNIDVNLWHAGTAIHNEALFSTLFNLTIPTGRTVTLNSTLGDVAIDGTNGQGSGNSGGTYTINGTLNINGTLIASNNNTASTSAIVVGTSGVINAATVNANLGLGNGTSFTFAGSNSRLNVSKALKLISGSLSSTSNVVLLSTATGSAYLDNFTTGYTGSLSGTITAERYIPNGVAGFRYIASPVNNGGSNFALSNLTGFTPGGTAGQVIPQTPCNTANTASNSPYGTFMYWNEAGPFTANTPCYQQEAWYFQTGGNMIIGKGYGAKVLPTSTIKYTGTPNNGTVSMGTLVNSAGPSDGWQLVANPYPSPIKIDNTDGNANNNMPSGFDYQIKFFQPTGAYQGSYQSYTGNVSTFVAPEIAIGQGFWVRTASSGTWSLNNNYRTTGNNPTYYDNNNSNLLSHLKVDVAGNGFMDKTDIAFVDATVGAADGIDANDANKWDSRAGQPTVFTKVGDENIAINVLPSLEDTKVIPMGFKPGADGSFTFTFGNVESFPASAMIYLEDLKANTVTNMRTNTSYTFSSTISDNEDRFLIRFEPPVKATVTEQTCDNTGSIELTQEGNVVWDTYSVVDNNNATYAQGTNYTGSVTISNLPAQEYIVTLTHASGYVAQEYVTVNGVQGVQVTMDASASTTAIGQAVTFIVTAVNAATYEWNFGDGELLVSTNTTESHAFANAGTYNVNVTAQNDDCSAIGSQTIVVTNTTTGITNQTNSNLNVFGYDNHLVIEFNNWGENEANVLVYNMLGQQMASFTGVSTLKGRQELNIVGVTPGCYVIQVVSEGKTFTKKLVLGNN